MINSKNDYAIYILVDSPPCDTFCNEILNALSSYYFCWFLHTGAKHLWGPVDIKVDIVAVDN